MNNLIGRQIKHYRMDALLGEGGMGAVYRAYDLNLARPVALKIMHRQLASQSKFQKRFMQEAQAVARLSHSSIVVVHDFDNDNGEFYIVMELVPGISLGAYIKELAERRQVMRLSETAFIIAQVADALDYAHQAGIIHRDIKPDNILIKHLIRPERPSEPPLRAVVTDFGLAKLLEGGIETATGTFMGTLPYMSPEQALAKKVDNRSDVYSLGVVLYQLATGQLPFDIQTPTDAVMKHLHETPPEPRQLQPGLPEALAQVIVKSLAKQPDGRFQTGAEMAQALRQSTAQLTDEDATHFVTASQHVVVSLITRLATPYPDSLPEPISPEPASQDELIITRSGMTSYSYPLNKQTYTIGRTDENEIVLAGDQVSRHHARLEKHETGWQITDLNSTNGTFLGKTKLLPQMTEDWPENIPLRIGNFWLRLKQALVSPANLTMVRPDGTIVAPEEIYSSPGTGQIGIHLLAPEVTITPGGTAVFPLIILNQGDLVDHFSVRVAGLPAPWPVDPVPVVRLMPGQQQEVVVSIRPPHSPHSRAGAHAFQISVAGQSPPQDAVEVQGRLHLTPFYDYQFDLRPQIRRSSDPGEFTINVQNQGNTDLIVQFTAVDTEDTCWFTFQPNQINVPAAGAAKTILTIGAKTTYADNKTHYFTITAQSIEASNLRPQCQGTWEQIPAIEPAQTVPVSPKPATAPPEPTPRIIEPLPPVRPMSLPEKITAKRVKPRRAAGCAVFILGAIITAAVGWGVGAGSDQILPNDIANGGSLALASVVWLGGFIYTIIRARKVWKRF